MKSVVRSNYSKVDNHFVLNISYDDGTGESKQFDTEDDVQQYLVGEESTMSKDKNNDATNNADNQDPHVNAPGESYTTPEKAASDMSVSEAEAINSNVNAAPVPQDARTDEINVASNNLDADSENGSGNLHAPHDMGVSDKPNNGQQVKENV